MPTTLISSRQNPPSPPISARSSAYGIFWEQTTGQFFAPGVYGNMNGIGPLFVITAERRNLRDYDTRDYNDAAPTHEFNAEVRDRKILHLHHGRLRQGLFRLPDDGRFDAGIESVLSRWANQVTVGTPTIITYSAALFHGRALNLIDYSVSIPTVGAGDAWAGQNIGLKIESIYGVGDGYWDIDNVRLTAVPEPTTLGLLALGGVLASVSARGVESPDLR